MNHTHLGKRALLLVLCLFTLLSLSACATRKNVDISADSIVAEELLTHVINDDHDAACMLLASSNTDMEALWSTLRTFAQNADSFRILGTESAVKKSKGVTTTTVVYRVTFVPSIFIGNQDQSSGNNDQYINYKPGTGNVIIGDYVTGGATGDYVTGGTITGTLGDGSITLLPGNGTIISTLLPQSYTSFYLYLTTNDQTDGIVSAKASETPLLDPADKLVTDHATLILTVVGLASSGWFIWALVDCLRRKPKYRLLWILAFFCGASLKLTVGLSRTFGLMISPFVPLLYTGSSSSTDLSTTLTLLLPVGAAVYLSIRHRLPIAPPKAPKVQEETTEVETEAEE